MNYSLPSAARLHEQAEWLAPLRARILRRGGIAHRQRVLDFGAGYGSITPELVRRSGGHVVALDSNWHALSTSPTIPPEASALCANGTRLPFTSNSFDMVFCQWVLLWVASPTHAIAEIARVLQPGGVFIACEPDYGGMIEYPPQLATRNLWIAALRRAGANPLIGREIATLCAQHGLHSRIDLIPELHPPRPSRYALLRELPLTTHERIQLTIIAWREKKATATTPWHHIAHVPCFVVTAEKPAR